MERQLNIVFIVIDALRARNLGCYGYAKQTSPNIDSLAKEGVLFENAYSCAPYTYPSITSILSGEYPLSHGILGQEFKGVGPKPGTVFLPEILKSEGYTNLAIDWLGGWFKSGFHYYSGLGGVAPHRHLYKFYKLMWRFIVKPLNTKFALDWANFFYQQKIHAGIITNQVIALMKKVLDRNFFFFIHYWDPHIPYNPPKNYIDMFMENDYGEDKSIDELVNQLRPKQRSYVRKRLAFGVKTINEVRARYDAAIAYVDNEIGRLMKVLEAEGIIDKTLVVITSDHGESLTEHEIYFTHHALYDVTTHVPLILYYPDHFPRNMRVCPLVQHVDLTPTLLDVLEVKSTSFDMDGKSFLPLIYNESDGIREAVFMEEVNVERKRAIRTDKYKYIQAQSKEEALCKECDKIHGGIEELYEQKMDPGETNNVINEHPDIARKLRKKLFEWAELLNSKKVKEATAKTGKTPTYYTKEEEKLLAERLKELGYF